MKMKKVAIVGAGPSGLAAIKYVLENGMQPVCFEMRDKVGGTWYYTNDVSQDQYGCPVYSAMYKNLRTNLPKEVMSFRDFKIPDEKPSYLSQEEILQYLNKYAIHYDINKYIQFDTMVKNIHWEDDQFTIKVYRKLTKKEEDFVFDYVIICVGHYNEPVKPELPGQEKFPKDKIDHSQNYREPEKYKGQRVLLIGSGPSGLELALLISDTAKHVVLSHHSKDPITTQYPVNVELKQTDIKQIIDSTKVEFTDGSYGDFDTILFCTGYTYSFPFLDKSCEITIENNHVQTLYKHMINIKRPKMCFIGIPSEVCPVPMFDLQAEYCAKYLSGSIILPTPERMQEYTVQDEKNRTAKLLGKHQMHLIGKDQQAYYDDLAKEAETTSIPPVVVKIRERSVKRFHEDFQHFREDHYTVIDAKNYRMAPNQNGFQLL